MPKATARNSLFSTRVSGAPVSTPVTAAELKKDFAADQWTIETIDKRLKTVGNLWGDFWEKRQSLTEALEFFGSAPIRRKIENSLRQPLAVPPFKRKRGCVSDPARATN